MEVGWGLPKGRRGGGGVGATKREEGWGWGGGLPKGKRGGGGGGGGGGATNHLLWAFIAQHCNIEFLFIYDVGYWQKIVLNKNHFVILAA